MATVTVRKSTRVKKAPKNYANEDDEENSEDVETNAKGKKRSLSNTGYSVFSDGKRRKTEPAM